MVQGILAVRVGPAGLAVQDHQDHLVDLDNRDCLMGHEVQATPVLQFLSSLQVALSVRDSQDFHSTLVHLDLQESL